MDQQLDIHTCLVVDQLRFIPTQNIFLQDHGFETGDKLIYSSDEGTPLLVSNGINAVPNFRLTNNSPVFAIRESKDLLGISTNVRYRIYWRNHWYRFNAIVYSLMVLEVVRFMF